MNGGHGSYSEGYYSQGEDPGRWEDGELQEQYHGDMYSSALRFPACDDSGYQDPDNYYQHDDRGRGGEGSRDRSRERRHSRSRSRSRERDRRDRERSRRSSRSRSRERRGDRDSDRRHRERTRGRRRHSSEEDDVERDRSRRGEPQRPLSSTLYVKGIPLDKTEDDLTAFFSGMYSGVLGSRVILDRYTGRSRGFAFLDCETPEAAQAILEGSRYLEIDGQPLRLEYSLSPPSASSAGSGGGGGGASALADWLCDRCGTVNFQRRLECYQCSHARPKDPQRINIEPDGPSPILKVSGLEPQTADEDLQYLIAPIVPIKEVRLVRDKFTSAPRGFAFVHFHSIADATRALHELQNATLPGQETPLKLCYARDRLPPPGASGGGSNVAADALAAANFASQYSAWEPKEFDPNKPSEESAKSNNGYQYDANTGYYYDAASGYYYDPNTGLFCNSSDQQWYMYNSVTGTYLPVGQGGDTTHQTHAQAATAAPDGKAAAPAAVFQPAASSALEKKKKGAVIGAAPQLSTEALLAKAKAAKAALAKKQKADAAAQAAAAAKAAQSSASAASGEMATALPAARPIQGVVHESKRGGPSGVIYQGKWRGGPKPPAPPG